MESYFAKRISCMSCSCNHSDLLVLAYHVSSRTAKLVESSPPDNHVGRLAAQYCLATLLMSNGVAPHFGIVHRRWSCAIPWADGSRDCETHHARNLVAVGYLETLTYTDGCLT